MCIRRKLLNMVNDKVIYVRKLNICQIVKVYYKYLSKDFPRNERRPLSLMIKGRLFGNYECLGAFLEDELVGYAFFIKNGNDILFDYLATKKECRNKGLGAEILVQVRDFYKNVNSIIGEVENPYYSDNESSKKLQTRRLEFYKRNGFVDTDVRTCTFGVNFIILQDIDKAKTTEQVRALYEMHYRRYLPKKLFENNILFTN